MGSSSPWAFTAALASLEKNPDPPQEVEKGGREERGANCFLCLLLKDFSKSLSPRLKNFSGLPKSRQPSLLFGAPTIWPQPFSSLTYSSPPSHSLRSSQKGLPCQRPSSSGPNSTAFPDQPGLWWSLSLSPPTCPWRSIYLVNYSDNHLPELHSLKYRRGN